MKIRFIDQETHSPVSLLHKVRRQENGADQAQDRIGIITQNRDDPGTEAEKYGLRRNTVKKTIKSMCGSYNFDLIIQVAALKFNP